jgi:hypothetical protein
VNKARKNHAIGVAGGVLSLIGVCVGILSVGRKTERRNEAAPVRSVLPEPKPIESLAERHCEPQEALERLPVPVVENEPQQTLDLNAGPRCSREMIADLAAQGQPAAAIAQSLGISVGEVQLTLRLQARTGSVSADAGEERKIFRFPSNPVAESSIGQ